MDDAAAAALDPGGHGSPCPASLVARGPAPAFLPSPAAVVLGAFLPATGNCDASGLAISVEEPRRRPLAGRPPRLLFLRGGRQTKDPSL